MTKLVCPECKGEIGLGIAINPEDEYGARYMLPVPLVNSETMIMIDAILDQYDDYLIGREKE